MCTLGLRRVEQTSSRCLSAPGACCSCLTQAMACGLCSHSSRHMPTTSGTWWWLTASLSPALPPKSHSASILKFRSSRSPSYVPSHKTEREREREREREMGEEEGTDRQTDTKKHTRTRVRSPLSHSPPPFPRCIQGSSGGSLEVSELLYVGGTDQALPLPLRAFESNFEGCLDYVTFDGVDISQSSPLLLRAFGVAQCTQARFDTERSYIRYHGAVAQQTEESAISLQFRTTDANGVLLYIGTANATADFVSLVLRGGQVVLQQNFGAGVTSLQTAESKSSLAVCMCFVLRCVVFV